MQRIKKNDQVMVITGKDKGATGNVLNIDLSKGTIIVKGVNVRTKHVKPRRKGEAGKIVKEEGSIAISNVMPLCPETKKPSRVRSEATDAGKRVRISARSGQAF